jgi:hypothetical protein
MELLLTRLFLLGSIGLRLLILYLLIRRRIQRRFLWFLTYTLYGFIEDGMRLVASGNPGLYSRVYWRTEIGEVSLLIAAFAESFLNVFREFTRLRWFVRTVWGCVGLALLYSLFKAWVFPPVHATHLASVIIALEVAVDYSVTAVGILFFLLTLFFRIKERQWEMGVIGGFTINASLAVFGPLILSAFGTKFRLLSGWLPAVAYTVAELMWVVYFSRPERAVAVPKRDLTTDDLKRMDDYARILTRFLGRKS